MSFKAVGAVEGGAGGFIDALLEALGPAGTIMANTYTEHFGLSRIKTGRVDYVFDYRTTPCNTGLIPEMIRQRPDALRSRHPVTSVAAIGCMARYLTEGHGVDAPAYSPYSRLAEINGKYLSIGIGKRLVGFRHEAQYRAGLLGVVPKKLGVNYLDDDGVTRLFINREPPGCVTTLGRLVDHLESVGLVRKGKLGLATTLLVPVQEGLFEMTQLLKARPEINLCDRVGCLWCRELERRMGLYGKLETRRYFQRYRAIIGVLALLNWLRMGENPLLTQARKAIRLIP
jgi:aminoglycoside 3-N-acetyltransferase